MIYTPGNNKDTATVDGIKGSVYVQRQHTD